MATHFRLRLYLLALMIIAAFGVLLVRLYSIQIDEFETYQAKLPSSSQVTVRIPGVRGEIKDRNGVTLVENMASFEVSFDLQAIYNAYKKEVIAHNKEVEAFNKTAQPGEQREKREIKQHPYQVYVGGQPKTLEEPDIVEIVKESVIPAIGELSDEKHKLVEDFNARDMRIHYRSTQGLVPYVYRSDLSFEEFARFAEHNVDVPGVSVSARPIRRYVYDSLASHILGYVRPPDVMTVPEEKRRKFDHYVGDDYGVHGIEKTMDHLLQGKPGKRVLMRDVKGRLQPGDVDYEAPEPGSDVYLTIDARMQMITENALRAIGRGAAVVTDPRTGDVLAIASVPSFNPNKFIPSIDAEDYDRYVTDPSSPMFNRAINPYNPGSTAKIATALAGCLDKTQERRFNCSGGVMYGNHYMKCWIASKGYGHGSIDCSTAIKYSCNCFFYQYANVTKMRNMETMFGLLGMGRTTGIEITGESAGTVPGPEWMKMQGGGNWSSAYTAMTAIGQGFMEASPVQMSSMTATVANGGLVYQPRLVHRVMEKDGTVVQQNPPLVKHDLTKEGVTADDVEMVKKGMWRVCNEAGGTAGRASSELTTISGKTGTTQTGNPEEPNNAWFIAFAPYEEPELAVSIFVQNGKSGGGAASPIAKKIIEEITAMNKGKEIELASLDEAIGHFERIESVSFDDEGAALAQYAASEAEAVDVSNIVPTKLKKRTVRSIPKPAAPSIKKKADAEGAVQNQNQESKSKWDAIRRRPLSRFLGFGNDDDEE